jgi:hypothetical protein
LHRAWHPASPAWLDKAAIIAFLELEPLPTIRRFAACKIAIYADDHLPPHFHIEGRGFRAMVEIETMNVRAGETRRAQEAMAWARENLEILRAEWVRLNRKAERD